MPTSSNKTRVGIIGLGSMGITHLDVYAQMDDVEIVAVADRNSDKRSGEKKATGNIEGHAQGGFDLSQVKGYATPEELIADPNVDAVDLCLPTPAHLPIGKLVIESGKHLLIEKPLARTASAAKQLVDLADEASQRGQIVMPAMCMRYWPGWTWLKQAIDQQTYGQVLAATFTRLSEHPGGKLYLDGELCGGAILDFHLHDTDFIYHCFGLPESVSSVGYTNITGAIDHVQTQYHYPANSNAPKLVTAEGGWGMAQGFPFTMRYQVNFEQATALFDISAEAKLTLIQNGESQTIDLPDRMGYVDEIHVFIEAVRSGELPEHATMRDALPSIELVEAEEKSIAAGQRVELG